MKIMINIRRNCFETNSSSMHSLVVSKIVKPYTKEELALGYSDWEKEKDRDFDLWHWYDSGDMYFERGPFQVLREPVDKLRYYVAYTLGNYKKPSKAEIKRIQDFVMKQTGITDRKKIILSKEDKEYVKPKKYRKNTNYGWVSSNDSGEDPMHYVHTHQISMEELILNPKYTIIVDGDESRLFKSLFEAGIIDAENLDDISSGADFWNDSDITFYDTALYNKDEAELKSWIDEAINPVIKNIVFRFEFVESDENDKDNHDDDEEIHKLIKDLIDYAKSLKADIKSVYCAYTYSDKNRITMNDLKDLDLSMYDKVEIENHDDERW